MKKAFLGLLIFWFVGVPIALLCWVAQPFFFKPALTSIPDISPDSLQRDVEVLSVTYAERNFLNLETLNQAANYIHQQLSGATINTQLQTYKVDGEDYHNVIAHFGPSQGQPLIIGAHYDAFEKTAGADDNASGVAGLLALAKLLKENPPSIPVELVAYTLEEPPFFRTEDMGSRRHAAKVAKEGIQPRLVIVLEMIGYFSDVSNSQKYPIEQLAWLYPTEANFIAVVGHLLGTKETRQVKSAMQSATDLPVLSLNAPALLAGVDFSDHASYWYHDMPAIMVTDTAFFRNQNYHHSTDLPSTLDYERMAKVVQGVYGVIKYIGQ